LRKLVIVLILTLILAIIVGAVGCGGEEPPTSTPSPTLTPTPTIKLYAESPPMIIDISKHYTAIIETEKGNITLELFAKDVPVTVNNFVFLAREGYYNNCTFHRVMPGFMAQGGDPTGTGFGGPGYYIPNEISEHKHVEGALSMANAGPNTNGSQFFITYAPQHGLDGDYSVFGQLTDGMDVLTSLTPRDPAQFPNYKGDTIVRITIEES